MIAFICAFGSVVVATLLHIGWKNLKYDSITIEDEEHKTLYIALATMILSSPLILLMCYIAIFFITLNMWFSFEMNSYSSREETKSKNLKLYSTYISNYFVFLQNGNLMPLLALYSSCVAR